METIITNIFIQARMTSSRFPGKVLAPFYNKPLIKHIVDSARKVNNTNKIIVLTSVEQSDDPLSFYLDRINCHYFRGSLDNVFHRFQCALTLFPCDYFVRLSGDSPLLNSSLIEFMIQKTKDKYYDIISNVLIRTFPKGQSVEIIKTRTFMAVDKTRLAQEDCEHIFPYFYRDKDKYTIFSLQNKVDESHLNLCIDTLQDLERLSSSHYSYQFQHPLYES